MNMQLLLPTIIAPGVLSIALLLVSQRFTWLLALLPIAVALLATVWLEGVTITNLAMLDGFWLMALLACASVALSQIQAKKWAVIALIATSQAVALFLVRRFADSIEPLAWIVHVLMLVVPSSLLLVPTSTKADKHWVFTVLVASIALLAPIVGLGGSIKMAQMLGALATGAAFIWLAGMLQPTLRNLSQATLLAAQLPAAWLALSAYHLSGTAAIAVALPAIVWATLLLRNRPLVAQAAVFAVLVGAALVTGLWLVWPEQSLY
ncbi:hypothetical protein [Salinibius halmophilus]|uniref:hypothetical protein n=1 Tax=Salinibius halmophilus TaxID=1853216 RepID=UPI000E65EF51|nr:hypothetical protein [Salinibius halmophilus]